MLILGLTGQSGAGKSLVGELFEDAGLPVLDADAIYHGLLIPPSVCLDELTEAFGKEILNPDETLNRQKLSEIAFGNREKLALLNRIAHKHVVKKMIDLTKDYEKQNCPAVVWDAPQLFESGANLFCDVIIAVVAEEERRIKRIVRRDNITREAALRRISAQKSEDFFRENADFIIENNDKPTEELQKDVLRILAESEVLSE